MKVTVECSKCGAIRKADVSSLIKTLIECVERDSIYGGFLCEKCAQANSFDEDED